MESNNKEADILLAIINNIPPDYHSRDLRNYFSQLIEAEAFDCFHFRHRPESKTLENNQTSVQLNKKCSKIQDSTKQKSTMCCVVRMKAGHLRKLMKMYHRKHWLDTNGDVLSSICYISEVKFPSDKGTTTLHTRGESKTVPADREVFTEADLSSLLELHPPDIMPNGNVGTPTLVFLDFIKQCRLPPSIIKKLDLSFPKTRTNKKYGSVPFNYGTVVTVLDNEYEFDLPVLTGEGHEIVSEEVDDCDKNQEGEQLLTTSQAISDCDTNISDVDESNSKDIDNAISGSGNKCTASNGEQSSRGDKKANSWRKDPESKKRLALNIEEKIIGNNKSDDSDKDNDECEEWERHEALYDDPANQERNKERLFEEKIELKWEKGGSGLVFYTDAQYWHAQEGDFDEQTADDWDVDMSVYYEDGAGDKDARDVMKMRQEQRRRDGIEDTDMFTAGIAKRRKHSAPSTSNHGNKIGKFESHTRGVGRLIMEQQGWKDGQGLGTSVQGISDALDNDGQAPRDKRGFGYRGQKLVRYTPAKRKVVISTVYDDPKETDPVDPLLRRNGPYMLTYRDEKKFERGKDSVT